MNSFTQFMDTVYRLSFYLGHQWATIADADVFTLFNTKPKLPSDIDEMVRGIDELTQKLSSPGPCGWGITSPCLRMSEDCRYVHWHHTTAGRRMTLEGRWDSEHDIWHIEINVCRPYPWQPIVAKIVISHDPYWGDDPYDLFIDWYPPVGVRHAAIVREILSEAIGVSGEIEFAGKMMDDAELVEADVENLRRYYSTRTENEQEVHDARL